MALLQLQNPVFAGACVVQEGSSGKAGQVCLADSSCMPWTPSETRFCSYSGATWLALLLTCQLTRLKPSSLPTSFVPPIAACSHCSCNARSEMDLGFAGRVSWLASLHAYADAAELVWPHPPCLSSETGFCTWRNWKLIARALLNCKCAVQGGSDGEAGVAARLPAC